MHRVELRFEGGAVHRLETDGLETVYQAAARAGAPILVDCLEGACATCKARCLDGDYALLDPSLDALSSGEEEAGYVLLCQMQARGDCVVSLPYPRAFAAAAPPRVLTSRVAALERVAPAMVRLELDLDAPLDLVPGQYAQLEVPGAGVSRPYSFATPSGAGSRAVFYVRLLAEGAMGAYLAGPARPGDPLRVRAPLGGFYLRAGAGPVVMLAGGTGLAPLLAMLHGLAAAGWPRPVRLVHGAREPAELFGRAAMAAWSAARAPVQATYVVEEPGPGWTGPVGRVTDLIDRDRLGLDEPGDADVYVCGPPPMVVAAERALADLGVPEPRLFTEPFNPA